MKTEPREEWLNIPNALTALRILLTFAFLALYIWGLYVPAIIVFVTAASTDMVDGWLARKLNRITKLGKILDPIADKLMIVSALVALTLHGWCPWWLLITIAVKELLMLVGGLVMLTRGIVIPAIMIGKIATVMFIAAIVLTFFHEYTQPFDLYAQGAVCVISVAALAVYARKAYYLWKAR
ncbi:MAG: CDP-alcohol phosphatidyltransferase family protein [Oscillospiraceae bacterium]|jgi:cardiolipin synthase|nr:CDP-alcohol phosphatidyltransferase family protein [Oscillospiraceae bacterium]